jgi:hypothetical protein
MAYAKEKEIEKNSDKRTLASVTRGGAELI